MLGQFLLLLVINVHTSLCIEAMYDAGKEVWELYMMIDNLELDTVHEVSEVDELLSSKKVTIQDIKRQMAEIHRQLSENDAFMKPKTIQNKFKLSKLDPMMVKCMDRFEILIENIDELYGEFDQYINVSSSRFDDVIENLPPEVILDIQTGIEVIRKMLTDGNELLPNHQNLVSAIVDSVSAQHAALCNTQQSISDLLIYMFRIIMIAEMKVNVILALVNIYQYSHSEGWRDWNSLAREQFKRQFGDYVNIFGLSLGTADALPLRACDPDGMRIRGHSFHELEGTVQATLFRHHWARCKYHSCNDVWFNKADSCEPAYYDLRTSCEQTMAECVYLSAIKACVLKSGPHKFLYVNSTALGFLGKDEKCLEDNSYIISDGTGWEFVHGACACNCFRNHNKISLHIMESNVQLNRVITGVRFFRKDSVLYIQPREGKLDANGHVLRNTERWLPIRSEMRSSQARIDINNKVFFFDDLRLPPYFVLTGVKFNKVTRGSVTGFALEIFGTAFYYKTGQLLIDDKSRISRRELSEDPGKSLSFQRVSSADVTFPNILSPPDMKYVSLERSTLRSDFGQSTLPLFDGIPILTRPPTALGGIGISHKGTDGYAGYISLRAYGIQYQNYFHDFQILHMNNDKVIFNN